MFNNFSKLKLSLKLILGFLFVELISLAGGFAMGRHLNSGVIILGIVGTLVICQLIAWLVSQDVKKSILSVLDHLSETSNNLGGLSIELTTTGHKLAEGSTEQAASIQETSSTLEESSSMVHQTTQNTKEAEILAKKTKAAANKGNSEMDVMLKSMEELKRSSAEISKIIKVIDEIAFQTNILSLNAAVEAARAGDAGKGFAVVAEEVRNLAQRSAQSAKDSAAIVESNINLSEKCLNVTGQVSTSLAEINNESGKVSELLEEIATASQEQEIGIVQINQAISQMENVLQGTATTATESAVSAEQLSIHSDTLKSIMGQLNFIIDGDSRPKATTKTMKPVLKQKTLIPPMATVKKTASYNKKAPQTFKPAVEARGKAPQPIKKTGSPEDIIPLDDF